MKHCTKDKIIQRTTVALGTWLEGQRKGLKIKYSTEKLEQDSRSITIH